jgi:uncharacterized repeat protein (TIGR01451 family)
LFSPLAPPFVDETAVTYKADCTTAETHFSSGDVVCVKDSGYTARTRAIYWVNPDGAVVQTDPISSASDSSTRTVNAPGVWKIYLVGFDNEARDVVDFTVSDPARTTFDLSVYKNSSGTFTSNGVVSYQVLVKNAGPDDATGVVLTEVTPNNASPLPSTQDSGPTFTCGPAGGNTVCTIATLPSGASASFTFFYQLDGSPTGTAITSSVTIEDSTTGSATPSELHPEDNTWSTLDTIEGTTAPGTCSVGCPENVTKQADTTQGSQSGAIVHFSTPVGNEECGPIITDHCNDCFFPVGTTLVTASAATGESCSFNVIVSPASGNATISCPGDHTADADANCEASIAIGTPTVAGDNVTVSGVRSDGRPLYNCDCYPAGSGDECETTGACTRRADAPFAAGQTTILWTAYSHDIAGPYADSATEEAHRTGSASCVQTFTVNDVTPPTITATNTSASADANCQAPVPDYATLGIVVDNCACASSDTSQICDSRNDITINQSPAAGTMVGLGPHTITLTANDGSSNNGGAGNTATFTVTFTVNDTTAPVISCPSNQTVNTAPGTCSAAVVTGTATATDNCDSTPTITGTRSDSQPLVALYPKGTTTITWRATDDAGNYSECTQTITVVDNVAPTITFNGQTPSMWPPNHAYQTFTAANFISSVSDNCDSLTVGDVDIISATSDEVENGDGDGNTVNDIVIAANCKSIQLRAERQNNGNGRVYTITFRLRDTSGNTTTGTAKVYAPKNEGETPVDSGVHYTVNGTCP